jgi:putative ABC transport system ATP-binding protein
MATGRLAIELRGLVKRYPPRDGAPRAELLAGLDLEVQPGECVAIEGQSGSGKSTLLHLLGGLDRDYGGSLRVLGEELAALDDERLSALRARSIGFVFQSFNLLPQLTALENVLLPDAFLGLPDAGARARQGLERVGLAGRERAKPFELSGGERQRVAIARALLAGPPLLLCDEPTGNLDARTGEGIIDLFRGLNREGTTLLIVTHEGRVSRAASRVLLLREGRLQPAPVDPLHTPSGGAVAGAGPGGVERRARPAP